MIIEKWKQSQTYVIGKDHIKLDSTCQDRTYYSCYNGVHVIALADGAGSRQHSEIGAEIITKKICEILANDFTKYYMSCERRGIDEQVYLQNMKNLKKKILNILLSELKTYAVSKGLDYDDLSSTLLFCAIYNNKYIIGHIGDGVVGGLFEEDNHLSIKTLSEPKNGGAPNITFFVTDSDALNHLRIYFGEFTNLRGIILMSDGPGEVMYHKKTGLNDNVIRIFENFNKKRSSDYNKILEKFLNDKIATYSSDDLSLNLLYLEYVDTTNAGDYSDYLLKGITSKDQINYKSQYCVHVDPSLKASHKDFSSIHEVRSYIKWT